jgi:hypothetical protein
MQNEATMRKFAGLTTLVILLGINGVSAQTISPDCAKQELQLVVLIEELGDAGVVPAEKLASAYSAMLEAREVCRTGQVAQALRMFDAVSLESQQATITVK